MGWEGLMSASFLFSSMGGIAIAILIAVAVVHMYWTLGGAVGIAVTMPGKTRRSLDRPPGVNSLLVSLSLLVAADLMLVRVGVFTSRIPELGMRVACGALAAAFLARAICDFHHFGFFKRVTGSRFSRLDTTVYSPVCAYLAAAIGVNTW